MRLDYFISHATGLSRKQAKKVITQGDVYVEGKEKINASTTVSDSDQVLFHGQMLGLPSARYFMLNKPPGLVCSTDDSQHPSVLTLIAHNDLPELHIVGRLDLDTTGLLLLSNDGQWTHGITSPKKRCEKTYRVTLAHDINDIAINQLQNGLILKGESKSTLPTTVAIIDNRIIDITLMEGRYHQVKRMVAAIGNHVIALHRLKIGGITLDETLIESQYRPLTDNEITSI